MINFQDEMQDLAKLYLLKKSHLFNNDSNFFFDLLGHLDVFLIASCKRFHSKVLSYDFFF